MDLQNPKEAFSYLSEYLNLGYEGDELEECADAVARYDEAYKTVRTLANSPPMTRWGHLKAVFSGG